MWDLSLFYKKSGREGTSEERKKIKNKFKLYCDCIYPFVYIIFLSNNLIKFNYILLMADSLLALTC